MKRNTLTFQEISAALADQPLINPVNLNKLKECTKNQPHHLPELFLSYLEESGELVQSIDQSIATCDFIEYSNSVHSLKGLAGTIGFSKFFYLLKAMDDINKEHTFEESKKFIPLLKNLYKEIEDYIYSEFVNKNWHSNLGSAV